MNLGKTLHFLLLLQSLSPLLLFITLTHPSSSEIVIFNSSSQAEAVSIFVAAQSLIQGSPKQGAARGY